MKITLANLAEATAQQVFDQVAKHLLTQNAKSVDPLSNLCRYRSPSGLMCAAGCLMDDNEYTPKFENIGWDSLRGIVHISATHSALISRLQFLHDEYTPTEWYDLLSTVAAEYGLEWNFTR